MDISIKIFVLQVSPSARPGSQPFIYPRHNSDFGVEQDFHLFLSNNEKLFLVDNPADADFHYLPVYWTRWHLNHNYGSVGLGELQDKVNDAIIDENKTFTVCQYDDGPVCDLGNSIVFLSSRKGLSGFDIPLLCASHDDKYKSPGNFFQPKKHTATFVGRLSTHEIRKLMANRLCCDTEVCIFDGDFGTEFFAATTASSFVALCPRGYGGSSFRFFEAMSIGVVPFLIGDIDTRPFKDWLPWDRISFYTDSVDQVRLTLRDHSLDEFVRMGLEARVFYNSFLAYGKWPYLLLSTLFKIKSSRR